MSERQRRRSIFDLIRDYIEDIEVLAEKFFEPALAERPSWDTKSCCLEPLCSNINKETIKVTPISTDVIEIKAEMKRKIRFNELGITHRRGEFQFFRCQTNIPVPVNMDRIKTEFKRGILEVHLPRKKGYKIRVE